MGNLNPSAEGVWWNNIFMAYQLEFTNPPDRFAYLESENGSEWASSHFDVKLFVTPERKHYVKHGAEDIGWLSELNSNCKLQIISA